MSHILLLPHIKVHNANALSSPYTIGFPAMTAWLGAVHALQRKLNQNNFEEIDFTKVGVVSHSVDLQTYKGSGDYAHSIIGTRNPLNKDGSRPAFIEEARCHLDVSLIVECEGVNPFSQDELLEAINQSMNKDLKFAGGDVLSFDQLEILVIDDEETRRSLMRQLMPGYCLIERRDLMQEAMDEEQDAVDALLDCLSLKHRCEIDENGDVNWTVKRKQSGWIVPIATGFQGISPLSKAGDTQNQRDQDTPHRFAESVVTLGEFIMPYRLNALDEMMWEYIYDEEKDLYLCQQTKQLINSIS